MTLNRLLHHGRPVDKLGRALVGASALFLAGAMVATVAARVSSPQSTAPNVLSAKEVTGGWKLLFDGRTTIGWRGFHQEKFPGEDWIVEDGTLRHVAGRSGGDIITTAQYEHFDLRLEWRIAPAGNSGVKYLISEDLIRTGHAGLGFEMQILDDAGHPDAKAGINGNRTTGALYNLIPPATKTVRPVGQWNSAGIVVRGSRVEHWLNGVRIVEFDIGSPQLKTLIATSKYKVNPGFGDVSKGHILLQDHGDDAWFRNIKILELGRP